MSIPLSATDADRDPLTFYAQRIPAFRIGTSEELRNLASSALFDHGDGTADLQFHPRWSEAGQYPLRIAVFDEAGGVDSKDVTLIISEGPMPGDANCDGHVDARDIDALITALFNAPAPDQCVAADANEDGEVTASDLPAFVIQLSNLSQPSP